MLTRLNSMKSLLIAAMVLSVVVPKGAAQGVRPCKNGSCGSPLAGPCVPARVTYGHVETSWRRWPTDHAVAESKGAEELPTPATRPEIEPMPEPETPGAVPPGAREPGGAATDSPGKAPDGLTPPFGDAPTPPFGDAPTPPFGDAPTPAFGDEPPAFGDEPQAPPSAADPLAAPFSDEPPTPPMDGPSASPATPDPSPAQPEGATTPPTEQSPPELDSDGPPAMPQDDPFKDDPFKDDPDPKTGTAPGTGARTNDLYSDAYALDATAPRQGEATSGQPNAPLHASTTSTSRPRLLQANGENLAPLRILEPKTEFGNPLRQVSHPVRKTVFGPGSEAPAETPTEGKPAVWRHNPLR